MGKHKLASVQAKLPAVPMGSSQEPLQMLKQALQSLRKIWPSKLGIKMAMQSPDPGCGGST